ncbi:MAG: hypothetical protein JNJ61_18685 [Anaerolineae bacterium]|nr:hypothetical protein [Anaerolineae bacterium]
MNERQPPEGKISSELVTFYAETFINRWDRYPKQQPDGSYVAVQRTPLSYWLIAQHLLGRVTLGAYALDTQSRAKWICLDADTPNDWSGLLRVAQNLLRSRDQIPCYLEPSRRGGHLWLFTNPIPGSVARRFAKHLLTTHDLPQVEVYPKQAELRTGPGSLVRLPLGVHLLDHKRHHFVTLEGTPLAPTIREQIRILANPLRVPAGYIEQQVAAIPEPQQVSPTRRFQAREIIGDTPSERIKNSISVLEFVSQYVDLDRNGRGYCPFHDDSHMSFGVNTEGNFWHCFAGCGGGSVIDFWMRWQQVEFTQAIKELAAQLLPPIR